MRKFVVKPKYNEKKLNLCVLENFENLSQNNFFKALRKKDIRINDKKISTNETVFSGDIISVYLPDSLLYGESINFKIVYEDDNIAIVDKPSGLEVIETDENSLTLTKLLEETFSTKYYPCHRLDRNTSGLILYAKNQNSLNILLDKFRNKEIKKSYYCICVGIPKKEKQDLKAFLFKDRKKSLVMISNTNKSGYLPIETIYELKQKNTKNNLSLLEVSIPTGRTHQIRAHLSFISLPILGDGKYGINQENKKFKVFKQCLHSKEICFDFKTDSGILNYLKGKKFLSDIPKYFRNIFNNK